LKEPIPERQTGGQTGFRSPKAAAPLKAEGLIHSPRFSTLFPQPQSCGPIEGIRADLARVLALGFRSPKAAAPLKGLESAVLQGGVVEFPQPQSCGPIEGIALASLSAAFRLFPQPQSCGPIEGTHSATSPRDGGQSFRSPKAAAPLKG